jgi:hypothetical protein
VQIGAVYNNMSALRDIVDPPGPGQIVTSFVAVPIGGLLKGICDFFACDNEGNSCEFAGPNCIPHTISYTQQAFNIVADRLPGAVTGSILGRLAADEVETEALAPLREEASESAGGAAGSSPQRIAFGEVKPLNNYNKYLKEIAYMEDKRGGDPNGNFGFAMYNGVTGDVKLQTFGPRVGNAARVIIWEGDIGRIAIPAGFPPGSAPLGNAVEPLVRDLVGRFLGQDFLPKASNAPGWDLLPVPTPP